MKLFKTAVLATVLALTSITAQAANDCGYIKQVAHNISSNRQYYNSPLSEALEVNIVARDLSIMYVEDGHSDQSIRDILSDYDLSNSIAKVVYSLPLYETDEQKDHSIKSFEDAVYRNCINKEYE